MVVKVSVVIPVYNPGEFILPCVRSLFEQTMPATEWEAVFVDDGSVDATPAYLDDLAAAHENITVIHQPNSGWPGKPRNVGLDAARGAYVFFCDNDDWFGPEAFERLYDFAVQNDADVVIGKMAGVHRSVPQAIFKITKPRATLADSPLMDSLTPHKLFRREFLVDKGIRFPEGKRRLEDHLFVTTAYLEADVVSIYADYVCYYHIRRDDGGNAAHTAIDWSGYFANLAEAVDVVVAHTEPGPLRQRIYKRWLAIEMVDRLSGSRFRRLGGDEAESIFRAAHGVAARYFDEGTVLRLPPSARPVARAIIRGDFDDVARRAEEDRLWIADAVILQQSWRRHVLQIAGVATLTNSAVAARGAHPFAGLVDDEDLPTLATHETSIALDLTERRNGSRWPVPITAERRVGLSVAFTADLDPDTLAQGTALPDGIWDLYVDIVVLGLRRRSRLTMVAPRSDAKPTLRRTRPGRSDVAVYLTNKNAGLTLDVGLQFHPGLRRKADDAHAGPAEPAATSTPGSEAAPEPVEHGGSFTRLFARLRDH